MPHVHCLETCKYNYLFPLSFWFPCSSIIRCLPVLGTLLGIYSISSSIEHPSTSHILSMCSNFMLVAISLYHSFMALRLIPVSSDNCFCDMRRSPRSFDKCIFIITMPLGNSIIIKFIWLYFNQK